jgi:hypothetical protein
MYHSQMAMGSGDMMMDPTIMKKGLEDIKEQMREV